MYRIALRVTFAADCGIGSHRMCAGVTAAANIGDVPFLRGIRFLANEKQPLQSSCQNLSCTPTALLVAVKPTLSATFKTQACENRTSTNVAIQQQYSVKKGMKFTHHLTPLLHRYLRFQLEVRKAKGGRILCMNIKYRFYNNMYQSTPLPYQQKIYTPDEAQQHLLARIVVAIARKYGSIIFFRENLRKKTKSGSTCKSKEIAHLGVVEVSVLRQFVRSRASNQSQTSGSGGDGEPVAKKQKLKAVCEDGPIRILDALSASGLRAFRFSQEVENVDYVLANDFSENAVESIKENITLNGVEGKVRANFGDAVVTMMEHRNIDKRFHAVDLDPYGSASVFLDSAVQCVADRGILMVTCTDMAVLCGNTPETCYNKYGSTTVRLKCCHEMALRILLRSIDSHANRYSRYIEPLLSISVDFYVRVFVRLHTGARRTKDSATKVGNVIACSGCHSMEVLPILKKVEDGKNVKYCTSVVRQSMMGTDNKCVHCGHPVHHAGPIYIGPIHDRKFVEGILTSLKETPEEERLGTHNRLMGVLTNVSEEIDVPLYYEHDQLFNVVKCSVPKAVSGSHCNPRALKTNAPTHFLWDICRSAVSQNSCFFYSLFAERERELSIQNVAINLLFFTNTLLQAKAFLLVLGHVSGHSNAISFSSATLLASADLRFGTLNLTSIHDFSLEGVPNAKEANVTAERHDEKAPGHKILSEPIKVKTGDQDQKRKDLSIPHWPASTQKHRKLANDYGFLCCHTTLLLVIVACYDVKITRSFY
ncbi:N2,N2-dimethylguanosine tRNA methyltransferase [Ancylostoma ceylanicum]|uniref:tRNA (guanine(26)-N(2))-dimethyltransferase n=1 Tax=Ancylostoma ceylanicum TaxID=53326 RepID=A0A0D6LQ10_9BILA|nr:N2,N2-dimethylguanosine tRNA methyltransferase [Ancylostoma ceylanicum]